MTTRERISAAIYRRRQESRPWPQLERAQFSRCSHVPLDVGRISQQGEDRQPSVAVAREAHRIRWAKCVDARPEKAAERQRHVRLSPTFARRWPGHVLIGAETPTVDVDVRGTGAREATTREAHNGNRRGPSGHSRSRVGAGVPHRAARDRLHTRERALGQAQGSLRHVGRGQRPDRVLHLRRHLDDVRVHVLSGPGRSSSSATCPSSCWACAPCRGPMPAPPCSPSTGPATGPTAHDHLLLQLDHPDRIRGRGAAPDRGGRARLDDKAGFCPATRPRSFSSSPPCSCS